MKWPLQALLAFTGAKPNHRESGGGLKKIITFFDLTISLGGY